MPELQVDEYPIHNEDHGEAGSPPLVLVHGLYGEASGLAPLTQRFARWFRVIAPDALGHGLSSHPAEFGIEDQGRSLAGLIAALGYQQAAILGISMGSCLAAQAAILEPTRVSELVLVVSKAHGRASSTNICGSEGVRSHGGHAGGDDCLPGLVDGRTVACHHVEQ